MVAGLMVFFLARQISEELATIAAGDTFFIVYLCAMLHLARMATIPKLRDRARNEDEGILLIVALTVLAIAFSFGSMFSLLGSPAKESTVHLYLAIASIPLGWTVLHMLFGFHYSRLYYSPNSAGGKAADAGGLAFLDTPEPGIVEFMYFSFTIGATAQTSDVNLRSADFRKVALFHGMASFVFNTVLLALAVNLGASLVQ